MRILDAVLFGFSAKAIAEDMGCTVSSVRSSFEEIKSTLGVMTIYKAAELYDKWLENEPL